MIVRVKIANSYNEIAFFSESDQRGYDLVTLGNFDGSSGQEVVLNIDSDQTGL